MQRDIETLDAAPPSLPQLRGEEDSVRTHASRMSGPDMWGAYAPAAGWGRFHMSFTSVCTYFGRIDVYVTSRDQNGPAQGWRRSRLDMDLTVWIPWGSGGGLLRALQDRWKTWRFRGPGGAETANLLGVGRRF